MKNEIKETWKTLDDFSNKHHQYQISNLGGVRRSLIMGDKKFITIKPRTSPTGGLNTKILFNWGVNILSISLLVAKNFCREYKNGCLITHKDGNKCNNRATNLQVVNL